VITGITSIMGTPLQWLSMQPASQQIKTYPHETAKNHVLKEIQDEDQSFPWFYAY